MATPDATYLILFSANLAFIVTHIYGWLLKWFYKPEAYRVHFHELQDGARIYRQWFAYVPGSVAFRGGLQFIL